MRLDTNYHYTGQQFDPLSELYSLRARYYDASIGRFLSRDTWAYDYQNPVELNRYVYAANNPATMLDPTGHQGYGLTITGVASSGGGPGGWGRAFSSALGVGLGAAIGYISSNMMFNIMDSGACGGGLAAWAKSNRALYTTMAAVTGALIGGISGYYAPEIALGHPDVLPVLKCFGITPEPQHYRVEMPEPATTAAQIIADELQKHPDEQYRQVSWLLQWLFSCSNNSLIDWDTESMWEVEPLSWEEDDLAFARVMIEEADEIMAEVLTGLVWLASEPAILQALQDNIQRIYKAIQKKGKSNEPPNIRLKWPDPAICTERAA